MSVKRNPYRRYYLVASVFALFQKSLTPEDAAGELELSEDEATDFGRIRCPLCLWRPTAASRWFCLDSGYPEYFFDACGAAWNTFETRGLCPGCGHLWRWTACLRCDGWSLHEDWYEEGKR